MALTNISTPGVYIQEISTLPSSIVPVETAIPAFIGYTEKGPKNNAVRISSLIEYEANFGGAFKESYTVKVDNGNVLSITSASDSPYLLYYHMQMYFANGGGPCYIVSVNNYNYSSPGITASDFYIAGNTAVGIGVAEKVDEVTLLLAPEAAQLSNTADIRAIYDGMLAQCEKLKDRFTILDVNVQTPLMPNPSADATAFRNQYVSANSLNYGAAYYPPLDTIIKRRYLNEDVKINDARTSGNIYATQPNDRLATIYQGIGSFRSITVGALTSSLSLTVSSNGTSVTFAKGIDYSGTATVDEIVSMINNNSILSSIVRAQKSTVSGNFFIVVRQATTSVTTTMLDVTQTGTGFTIAATNSPGTSNSADIALGNSIKDLIAGRVLKLGAASSMAGIYAAVDNSRGVWKAPANVSVANIIGPSFQITEAQQGGLNVDPTSGKSINAIRSFTGRGTIVWGARTLDGNSNEWRYVPVRRLFIFVEESTKKASEFVVFEPNDKNTWLRVKAMITNFLTDLWRQGALAGDKPEQAFFVKVGLNETMTAQDILEGKLIVTIGLAAVRPAEFIVLQFMHKLQEA